MFECSILVPFFLCLWIEIWREFITNGGIPPVSSLSIQEYVVQDPRNAISPLTGASRHPDGFSLLWAPLSVAQSDIFAFCCPLLTTYHEECNRDPNEDFSNAYSHCTHNLDNKPARYSTASMRVSTPPSDWNFTCLGCSPSLTQKCWLCFLTRTSLYMATKNEKSLLKSWQTRRRVHCIRPGMMLMHQGVTENSIKALRVRDIGYPQLPRHSSKGD